MTRTTYQSPHIGLAITPRGNEDLWRLPSFFLQTGYVGCLERSNDLPVCGRAQYGDGGLSDRRIGVDDRTRLVASQHNPVVGRLWCQTGQFLTV